MTKFELPHETRIFALQIATEFVNGGKCREVYEAEELIAIAKKFEGYLTSAPIPGYEAEQGDE